MPLCFHTTLLLWLITQLWCSLQVAALAPASRRQWLIQGGASVASIASVASPAHSVDTAGSIVVPGGAAPYKPKGIGVSSWDPPAVQTKLAQSRLLAKELSPLQQPFRGGQELYYSPFLFGAWTTKSTLKRKIYPYGPDFLPSNSLLEGSPRNRQEQVGETTTYEVHYFSTLANTLANQATVNLGLGVPETKIIQDRAYNSKSLSSAYKQLTPVQDVQWDYRADPTKLVLDFGSGLLTDDMMPLGPRRGEVFITARTSEDGGDFYCAAERYRAVTLVTRDAVVADTETITEFHRVSDDCVTAWSRIAVYLTPNPNSREGILWQQTGGKAVAFFDYELEMTRIKEEFTMADGSTVQRACVLTPKDVIQCG